MLEAFESLKREVDLLSKLLSNPEPGLSTWCLAVGRSWKRVSDLFYGQTVEYGLETPEGGWTAGALQLALREVAPGTPVKVVFHPLGLEAGVTSWQGPRISVEQGVLRFEAP